MSATSTADRNPTPEHVIGVTNGFVEVIGWP
jgi:hypothetical protein